MLADSVNMLFDLLSRVNSYWQDHPNKPCGRWVTRLRRRSSPKRPASLRYRGTDQVTEVTAYQNTLVFAELCYAEVYGQEKMLCFCECRLKRDFESGMSRVAELFSSGFNKKSYAFVILHLSLHKHPVTFFSESWTLLVLNLPNVVITSKTELILQLVMWLHVVEWSWRIIR